ncbi:MULTISPECIES: AMP-binding protein [unclassified Pseudofrankia]|uniref:AMP-binding protein n=1 Tax=unclassified Pseudofrankia TaxID=2994372 RepID=UPI0008D9DF9B|nr:MULTISPECIES: AMP-binding protein [unclassified Pseudofrankia]MDT3440820.1 AMP-binding protein [Pseudofrankia sp. BMG5.37]OHV43664.1 long-chain fatty acid--CoA ligase [Pseudofrankia sp. BMG5.36]
MVYLLDAMERASREDGSVTFLSPEGDDRVSWGELYQVALRQAARLQEDGIGPGRTVAVLGLTSRAAVTAIAAVWLAGAGVAVLPTPARTMDVDAFLSATARHLDRLEASLVLVGPPFEDLAAPLAATGRAVTPLDRVLEPGPVSDWRRPEVADGDTVILQLTSGTTDEPRIVLVSHANLAANLRGTAAAIGHGQRHGGMLSWLPLSHDMGLVGVLAATLTCGQCDLFLTSPTEYLADPASWLRQAARHRVQTIIGPASAYAVAARLLPLGPRLDLSRVTQAMSGGEPIDPDVIEKFLAAARPHGLDPRVFLPGYGLAEATLAVTIPAPLGGLRVDEIDADDLTAAGAARPPRAGRPTRRLPLLGPPIAETTIRVTDPATRHVLPDRTVGEVEVRGPAVTSGYRGATSAPGPVVDGWLRTGDLGYLVDGELVICGRQKDLIIVGGRNIYPEEVERTAEQVPGVRAGNAIAFSVQRTGGFGEGLGIAVESRAPDPTSVERAVADHLLATIGLWPVTTRVLPPGSIPKTPSGKLQRAEAARRFGAS